MEIIPFNLIWAPGTYGTPQEFYRAIQGASLPVSFFGTTGSSLGNGAGTFNGGAIAIGPVGIYTMAARAWYDGGQYPSYDAAYSASVNTGISELFTVNVTASPTPANDTLFPSFMIGFGPAPLAPPKLDIALTNGQAVLSWPSYSPAFNLQTTTNIGPGNWLDIPGPFPFANGRYSVTNALSGPARYFRLLR